MKAFDFPARKSWLWRHRGKFETGRPGGRPRLLVDVSIIIKHDAKTGIQRVVRALWSELLKLDGRKFDLVPVFATGRHGYCYAPIDFLDQSIIPATLEPASAGKADHFLGLDLATHSVPRYRRQLNAWQAAGARLHFVVYDLLPLDHPDWFTRKLVTHFQRWFDFVAMHADDVVCISQQVAIDLRRRLQFRSRRRSLTISHLAMGSDISASRPTSGICDEVGSLLESMREQSTILMVGTVEPRKGYSAALAAFEYLWTLNADAPNLVIVGKPGWKTDDLQARLRTHPERGRRLIWLETVSDEALCKLYDGCQGVLMASQGEGFGLPLLEAAMHQQPVLARDLSVFREQQLPNVTYFSDDGPKPLAEDLLRLVSAGRGTTQAIKLPTWENSVEDLLTQFGLVSNTEQIASAAGRRLQA